MHYVVDGYNFGYNAHIAGRERGDDWSIVRHLLRCPALTNRANSATVIFDGACGAPQKGANPRLQVIYSRSEKADEVIKRFLESLARAQRRNYIAVTNDRSLAAYCRSLGVRVISVGKFLSIKTNIRRQKQSGDSETLSEKPTLISREDIELSRVFEKNLPRGAHLERPSQTGEHKR
jgi:predicted RNA-binding protein with PIN domain